MKIVILLFNLMFLIVGFARAMEEGKRPENKRIENVRSVHWDQTTGRRRSNSLSDMSLHQEYLRRIRDVKAKQSNLKNSNFSKSHSDLSEKEKKEIVGNERSDKLASYNISSLSKSAVDFSTTLNQTIPVQTASNEIEDTHIKTKKSTSKEEINPVELAQISSNKVGDIKELMNALKQHKTEQLKAILSQNPHLLNAVSGTIFKRAIILQFMEELCRKKNETIKQLWPEIISHADKIDKQLPQKMLMMVNNSIAKCSPHKNFDENVRLKLIKKDVKLYFIKDSKTIGRKKLIEHAQNEDKLSALKRSFYSFMHDEHYDIAIEKKLISFKKELKNIQENSTDSLTKKQGALSANNESQVHTQRDFENFKKEGYKLLLWPLFFKDIATDKQPEHIINWLITNLSSNEYKNARNILLSEKSPDSTVQEQLLLDEKWHTLLKIK